MTRLELVVRAGRRLRDTAHTHYTTDLLEDAINQGIDRIKQEVAVLRGMVALQTDSDVPILLPDYMHEMLSIYAQMRALEMDEKLYESRIANNEFEVKLASLKGEILSGEIIIVDSEGVEITVDYTKEQVYDTYYEGIPYDTSADGRYATDDREEYETTGDGKTVVG
jgi:hypothetical protein